MQGAGKLHRVPIFKILVPFVMGILFYKQFSIEPIWIVFSLIGLVLVCILFERLVQKKYATHRLYVLSWGIYLLFFTLGYSTCFAQDVRKKPAYFAHHDDDFLHVLVETCKDKKDKYQSLQARILGGVQKGQYACRSGRLVLTIKNSPVLAAGDRFIFSSDAVRAFGSRENIADFDWQKFYAQKGIYHRAFVTIQEDAIFKNKKEGRLVWYAQMRKAVEAQLDGSGLHRPAIAKAILLGNKQALTSNEKASFAGSGTMHVLAVSGLHVGLVYLLLLGLLRPFFSKKSKSMIFLILAGIWLYASLSSFAPSVKRASLMLSFLLIGQLLSRKIDVYNAVFLSALLLLFFSPHSIYGVGFQLSYSAVLGLVTFYPSL